MMSDYIIDCLGTLSIMLAGVIIWTTDGILPFLGAIALIILGRALLRPYFSRS